MARILPIWLRSLKQSHKSGDQEGEGFYQQKQICKDKKRCLLFEMHKHQHKATQITKNQANMTQLKEINKAPVNDSEEMEI